jgi:hypothetical protein
MHSIVNRLLFVTLIIINMPAASAQDTLVCYQHSCCCESDPTPAGVMISHLHQKKEWMVSYRYMTMGMNGLMQGNKELSKNEAFVNYLMVPTTMQMDMHMLMGMYGITNRLTVMVMLNYSMLSMNMEMLGGTDHHHGGQSATDASGGHHMQTSGFADSKLFALYGILSKNKHEVLLSAGVSIPTGSITMKGNSTDMMYPNQNMPYGMQLGSGSVEVIPGITYLYQKKKATISTQASAIIRTGANSVGYRWGNELNFNAWFAYQWLNWMSSSVRAEGIVADKIHGSDLSLYAYNEPAANPNNYGGQKVNGYIGTVVRGKRGILKRHRLGVEYGIPLYQYVNGVQMSTRYNLYASWSVAF